MWNLKNRPKSHPKLKDTEKRPAIAGRGHKTGKGDIQQMSPGDVTYSMAIIVNCACSCSIAKSCLTLCDPTDCSPPGSSVHGIPRQEYWNGLPCPPPEDLPHPGIELESPAVAGRSLLLSHQESPIVNNTVMHILKLLR